MASTKNTATGGSGQDGDRKNGHAANGHNNNNPASTHTQGGKTSSSESGSWYGLDPSVSEGLGWGRNPVFDHGETRSFDQLAHEQGVPTQTLRASALQAGCALDEYAGAAAPGPALQHPHPVRASPANPGLRMFGAVGLDQVGPPTRRTSNGMAKQPPLPPRPARPGPPTVAPAQAPSPSAGPGFAIREIILPSTDPFAFQLTQTVYADGMSTYEGVQERWPASYNFRKAVEDDRAGMAALVTQTGSVPEEGPRQEEETRDGDEQVPSAEPNNPDPEPIDDIPNPPPAEPIHAEDQPFHDFVDQTAYIAPVLAPVAEENELEPTPQTNQDTPIEIKSEHGSQGEREESPMEINWEEKAAMQQEEEDRLVRELLGDDQE